MSYPTQLTFGVFDAAARETLISNPIVWVWQVHAKAGKLFASLIDGGSALNSSSSSTRYLYRSMAPRSDVVQNESSLQRGDVIQLTDYTWRRVAGKHEIIFVIFKLIVTSRAYGDHIDKMPRENLLPYPHETASEILATLLNSSVSSPVPAAIQPSVGSSTQEEQHKSLYPSLDSQPGPSRDSSSFDSCSYGREPREKRVALSSNHSASGLPYSHTPRVMSVIPQYKQSGPISRRVDGSFIEIKNLTSFLGRWVVKGRFINKGEPRNYSNQRGEGKLWTCDLIDSNEENGTISCTFFNKAVDKFFPLINENEIYTVSRGLVRSVNRRFNSGSHPFELQLGEDADIQWLSRDDPTIPVKPTPSITPIADIAHLPQKTAVSICGIVLKVSEPTEIMTRSTDQPRIKREFTIFDQSKASIDVTFWGNKTTILDSIDVNKPSTVLIENARVDEYNGRKLSSLFHTKVHIDPDIKEAKDLLKGYEQHQFASFMSLTTSSWVTDSRDAETLSIADLREQALKTSEMELEDRGRWFKCVATLLTIDRDRAFYWTACPKCGKKVMPVNDEAQEAGHVITTQAYVCPGCNSQVDAPVHKYLLNIVIGDPTGSLRCTAMGDRGHLIIGPMTPNALLKLQAEQHTQREYKDFEDYFYQRLRKEYVFKLQAKSETYRDETRVRYRVFGVESINGILQNDTSQGPNSIATCRANMIKEAKRALNSIYARLPREG